MILDGEEILRPHLGLFTQPLSFIHLPVYQSHQHPDALFWEFSWLQPSLKQEVLILRCCCTSEAKGVWQPQLCSLPRDKHGGNFNQNSGLGVIPKCSEEKPSAGSRKRSASGVLQEPAKNADPYRAD